MRSRANRANDGSSAMAQDDFARYHPGVLGRRIVERLVSWMIVAIGTLVFVGDVFAQERYYEWRWQMHPMWWGVWGIGMMLMMFLFWLLVIAALVIGIRWLVGKGKSQPSDRALEILRERYARGEINKDEFEAKQKDLSS